ncbi:MAG: hypothetical protein V4603_00570 [Pseudomonadota bacterium]
MNKQTPTKTEAPVPLHGVAADNLRFIRATMESATAFTDVSGKGYVLGGITALVASWLAAKQPSADAWLLTWMLEALLAATVMLMLTSEKARVQGKSLWTGSGRRLIFAFLPAMAVGAVVTLAFHLQGHTLLLPGLWLTLYGAAIMTAGAHSIKLIPVMGALFVVLGSLQVFGLTPMNLSLGLGFGGLHIIFGLLIWRQHGG